MRSIAIMVPLELPKGPLDWNRFQQIVQARFKETRSRPFNTEFRVGIALHIHTSRLLDNSHLPLVLRRVIKYLNRAKLLIGYDVYVQNAEVLPATANPYIEMVLYEEEP